MLVSKACSDWDPVLPSIVFGGCESYRSATHHIPLSLPRVCKAGVMTCSCFLIACRSCLVSVFLYDRHSCFAVIGSDTVTASPESDDMLYEALGSVVHGHAVRASYLIADPMIPADDRQPSAESSRSSCKPHLPVKRPVGMDKKKSGGATLGDPPAKRPSPFLISARWCRGAMKGSVVAQRREMQRLGSIVFQLRVAN